MKKFLLSLMALVVFATATPAMPNEIDEWLTIDSIEELTIDSLKQSLSLPSTAFVMAESPDLMVFATSIKTSESQLDIVTLWTYKPSTGKLQKLLTTNPNSDHSTLDGDKGKKVDITSIPTISTVYINMNEDKILVDGYDDKNSYTYIISLTEGLPTIQVPCSSGVIGLESEEGLIIAQSHSQYEQGGRYSIISVLDWEGNCLKRLSLKNVKPQSK